MSIFLAKMYRNFGFSVLLMWQNGVTPNNAGKAIFSGLVRKEGESIETGSAKVNVFFHQAKILGGGRIVAHVAGVHDLLRVCTTDIMTFRDKLNTDAKSAMVETC